MAHIIRYLNPASSGGNGTTNALTGTNAAYATFGAWQTAEATNLVSDGDRHTLICEGGTLTENGFTITGWTTNDSSNYLRIYVAEGSRHGGVVGGGFKLQGAKSFGGVLSIAQEGVILEGLEIENTHSSGSRGVQILSGSSGDVIVTKCVITSAGVSAIGIDIASGSNAFLACDNLIYDCVTGIKSGNYKSQQAYNNTIIDCTNGIIRTGAGGSTRLDVRNNVCFGCTTPYGQPLANHFDTTDSSDNATDGSDASIVPGGSSVTSVVSGDFTNHAGDDWSLASGSALEDAGADLTTEYEAYDRTGFDLEKTDIAYNPRGVTWDIGAFERVGGGVVATPKRRIFLGPFGGAL